MILNNTASFPLFLMRLTRFVCMGNDRHGDIDDSFDGWYLGDGYWRAKAVREDPHDPESKIIGVTLLNPDKTSLELRLVEKAASVCLLGDYKGPEIVFKEGE